MTHQLTNDVDMDGEQSEKGAQSENWSCDVVANCPFAKFSTSLQTHKSDYHCQQRSVSYHDEKHVSVSRRPDGKMACPCGDDRHARFNFQKILSMCRLKGGHPLPDATRWNDYDINGDVESQKYARAPGKKHPRKRVKEDLISRPRPYPRHTSPPPRSSGRAMRTVRMKQKVFESGEIDAETSGASGGEVMGGVLKGMELGKTSSSSETSTQPSPLSISWPALQSQLLQAQQLALSRSSHLASSNSYHPLLLHSYASSSSTSSHDAPGGPPNHTTNASQASTSSSSAGLLDIEREKESLIQESARLDAEIAKAEQKRIEQRIEQSHAEIAKLKAEIKAKEQRLKEINGA
ncbi:hypothetical protein BDP27DRAFT_1331987 [Rhodocollybia butyracea]|uniref:Uncharacterized protein n=1 Tax=Rhodocollybia butyracea TaxID=206335 RepID=A0A9P5PP05_9AGAR|nr:hypothetical protein BDP27DRAFT_1331987 [Rhodocollybia butyracea]